MSTAAPTPAYEPPRARRLYGALVLFGLLGAMVLSVESGRPDELPGIALGSAGLLCVEKAAGAFAAYLFVLVVVVRAFAGELPSEVRGLKYAVGETRAETAGGITKLAAAQVRLGRRLGRVEELVRDGRISIDGKEERRESGS